MSLPTPSRREIIETFSPPLPPMDLIYRYDPHEPIAHARYPDADTCLRALFAGNERFADFVGRMQRATLGEAVEDQVVVPVSPLSLGLPLWPGGSPDQSPFALVLGCSDARVPIEQIFDLAFNDLFVIRIAGNVLGVECLGSVDYAVRSFGDSLKLVVVLGHTGCGAVTAAVDTYLSPNDYADIASTHALRSLVDRIQIAVRASAKALSRRRSSGIFDQAANRAALIEMAVYLNTAITAYDLRREVATIAAGAPVRVMYGVYDLQSLRVQAVPELPGNAKHGVEQMLAAAPERAEEFTAIAERLATAVQAKNNP